MRLFVAEKRSVACALAEALGVAPVGETSFAGDAFTITWCDGHRVELEEPAAYDPRWSIWRDDTLPMVPRAFRYRPRTEAPAQYRALRTLFTDARFDTIVNACDPGREGELIFRALYEQTRARAPVLRLWLDDLGDAGMGHALDALRPSADFDALADAARSRAEADWLIGMNATRAVTLRCRRGARDRRVFASGRVQTPTLALLVAREREIGPPGAIAHCEGVFVDAGGASWRGRSHDAVPLDRLAAHASIDDPFGPRVVEIIDRSVSRPPPELFDTAALQSEAHARFGWPAAHTLVLAQRLYERRLLSYPRTDCRTLPAELAPTLVARWSAVTARFGADVAPPTTLPTQPRAEHHAIVPTGAHPSASLAIDERTLFDLVVARFAAHFAEPATLIERHAEVHVGREPMRFTLRARQINSDGWTRFESLRTAPKTTVPDVGTRLALRSHAARAVVPYDDGTLVDAMKRAGLATAATRAEVIETLIAHGLVRRDAHALRATDSGVAVIDAIKDTSLASAELTARWETRLAEIATGRAERAAFMRDVNAAVRAIVEALRPAPRTRARPRRLTRREA